MKKTKYIFLALLSSVLAACSNIAEDERLIYVEPATVNRNVLIEDFTGQKCVNCPAATDEIHNMQSVYGEDHVIAVAIHCGPFGFSGNAKYKGLMTELGQEYWNTWFTATQGQPVAKINRGPADDVVANWSKVVGEELSKTTTVTLDVTASLQSDTRQLTTTVSVTDPKDVPAKLQLWLVEDGIVALQAFPGNKSDTGYVHNHVLRAALNGSWGESLNYQNSTAQITNQYVIPQDYNLTNCSLIAFVYNDSGVLQATIHKLAP